jgi:hypothetical protein
MYNPSSESEDSLRVVVSSALLGCIFRLERTVNFDGFDLACKWLGERSWN